jgi:hypothetical protein
MAYTNADTTPKVGFRPYHQTDPFGAAHLSGVPEMSGDKTGELLGAYYMNRPFDPWELYSTTGSGLHGVSELGELVGLGQNHPFKPQAWHLHGLGDTYTAVRDQINASQNVMSDPTGEYVTDLNTGNMIDTQTGVITLSDGTTLNPSTITVSAPPVSSAGVPAGTQLLYNATWATQTLTTQTPAGIESKVAAALQSKWGITVDSSNATSNWLVNQPGFSMYVTTHVDYGKLSDVKSIIDGEINAAGRSGVNSTINVVQNAPQVAAQTNAGLLSALAQAQASGDTVTAQAILKTLAATGTTATPAPSSTIAWLENNAMWIGIGLAGLIMLGPLSQGLFGRRR